MIEQIMYFTLGVLIATLIALLVLPAVWHRAVRLTTKRVEAAVPISIFEVQADKDQQRAFFALNQRRLELQTDAMRETITAHAATLETQRQRTFALETELKALQAQYHLATATGAERDVLLGEIQDQLADRTATVARLEEELAARTSALAALEATHRTLESDAQALAATLATREATLVTERERITVLEQETTDLRSRLADTTRRLEETAVALEAERTAAIGAKAVAAEAATSLSTDLAEVQAALALKATESDARREAIATLEAERDRLAGLLAIAERDLDANRAVVHAFEQRRASEFVAAEVENRRLADTLHMLKADHALMEEAIQRTSRDAGIQTEVEAAPTLSPEGLNALRDGVTEVAAKLAALTAKLEGSGSSVRKLVAEDATGELAARIRTLLDQETLPDDDASHDAELAPDTSATEVAAAKRSASKRGRAVAG
ncbi:coiled-coil domain-containing protein [Xanthobacter autotrophicus]|uniref:hypothetical protein n=1 Tax=Xanthobacter autotrophicus TaxID=280 RepID=UPI00372A78F9